MDFPLQFVLSKEELEQTKKLYDTLDNYLDHRISEEELYTILSEELSIKLINLFYRIYYNSYFQWGKKFELESFPDEYKKYEEKIRNERVLYENYGKMLAYYKHYPYNLPLYLKDELDQYRIFPNSIKLKSDRLPLDIPLFRWNIEHKIKKGEILWI